MDGSVVVGCRLACGWFDGLEHAPTDDREHDPGRDEQGRPPDRAREECAEDRGGERAEHGPGGGFRACFTGAHVRDGPGGSSGNGGGQGGGDGDESGDAEEREERGRDRRSADAEETHQCPDDGAGEHEGRPRRHASDSRTVVREPMKRLSPEVSRLLIGPSVDPLRLFVVRATLGWSVVSPRLHSQVDGRAAQSQKNQAQATVNTTRLIEALIGSGPKVWRDGCASLPTRIGPRCTTRRPCEQLSFDGPGSSMVHRPRLGTLAPARAQRGSYRWGVQRLEPVGGPMIKKVYVPLDGSQIADAAIQPGVQLARRARVPLS